MPTRPAPLLASALAAAALLSSATPARALEREWHVGPDLGLATFSVGGASASGISGGGHVTYGLTDAFDAFALVEAARFGSAYPTAVGGVAGVAYTLDVTQWVPYAGLLGGVYRLAGGGVDRTSPAAGAALGLDWRFTRGWSAGVQLRYEAIFVPDPFGSGSLASGSLRVERVWGF